LQKPNFYRCSFYAIAAFLRIVDAQLSVHLERDGSYHVFVNKQQWLSSSSTFFRANGTSYSTLDGSLKQLGEPTAISGKDTFGKWNGEMLLYDANDAKVSVSVRMYDTGRGQLAVFTQVSVDYAKMNQFERRYTYKFSYFLSLLYFNV